MLVAGTSGPFSRIYDFGARSAHNPSSRMCVGGISSGGDCGELSALEGCVKEVIPDVYTFAGLIVGRAYLIKDSDGLTMIDSGLPLAADKIVEQIEAAGYKARDVRHILVTHAHPDHVGGLPRLKESTGARVIASRTERPVIEGDAPLQRVLPERMSGLVQKVRPSGMTLEGTPVDRGVDGGETLPEVMDGLRVIATPGHSPGHLSFWQPERRLVFCGDVMVRRFGRLRLPFAAVTVDEDENKRSVRKLAGLNAATMCFGHGNPLTRNTVQIVRDFARQVGG
ncbi:MAG: MBL fold metallo-hydrolase [Actinomycetota bacterium]|nr:MBL fold metallo-hydrolase [Actinomycetota bacterium]